LWKLLAECALGALPSIPMRIIPRLSGAALAVALMLTGCVPTTTPAGPTTKPSATPVFANEAEALAAATKAYAAYVKVSDEIFADGGIKADRLKEVATGRQLKTNIEGFAVARSKDYRSSGGTKFDHVTLQSFAPGQVDALVMIYVCDDLSLVSVFNSLGESVVSESRPDRAGYQATFSYSAKSPSHLLLSDKESWAGIAC
jgi:hypothetical protein